VSNALRPYRLCKTARDIDGKKIVVGDRVQLSTRITRYNDDDNIGIGYPVVVVVKIHAQGADGTILTTDSAPDIAFPLHTSGRATHFELRSTSTHNSSTSSTESSTTKRDIMSKAKKNVASKSKKNVNEVLDNAQSTGVSSVSAQIDAPAITQSVVNIVEAVNASIQKESVIMTEALVTLELKRSDKERKSNSVVFVAAGYKGSVKFGKAFFTGTAPETLSLEGPFAPAKQPRVKMTAEERKAARAAQPKLTLAQKAELADKRAAKNSARAAKLREQLAKANASGDAASA
jgi:hypothetical protein